MLSQRNVIKEIKYSAYTYLNLQCCIWINHFKRDWCEPDNYLQRHTLLSQSGVHYVVLGNGFHPQQDHNKRGQEVDIKQSPIAEKGERASS